ncbi:hypothetical protein BGY98DRAFT_936364 [Russula aff. rugulosa BPL654]|nr:hypothetical protein BGY98DRAFT_936364 [Russula aff. rugulosa BPL654]
MKDRNTQVSLKFYLSVKLISSAICHGLCVCGADGKYIFSGKEVTAFSNTEEGQPGKLQPKVVHSGKPITGQNPDPLGLLLKRVFISRDSEPVDRLFVATVGLSGCLVVVSDDLLVIGNLGNFMRTTVPPGDYFAHTV